MQDPRPHAPGFPVMRGQTALWAGAAGAARFRCLYADRLRTASVYRISPDRTYTVLLAPTARFERRTCRYREWAPGLAPRRALAEAYACGRLSWEAYAARYLAELDAFAPTLPEARARAAALLDRYPTLTLLGTADDGDESAVRCPRRLLRLWLLGEPVPELAHLPGPVAAAAA